MADYYTWSEYVAGVKKLLPIEAQRVGVGATATDYLTSLIRQAVIDLQRVVAGFRIGHETIYYPDDLVQEGMAKRGVKPPQSKFRDLSIFKIDDDNDEEVHRYPGIPHLWEKRFELVDGLVASNDGQARFSIDPHGYTFYVYPMPSDECWHVSMFWDGTKLDFQDDEQVPFSEASMLAVSYFVKANTSIEVEDAVSNAGTFMALFEKQKINLCIDDREQRGLI